MAFDKDKFAKHLRDHAEPPFGIGKCATYVRQAMVAAGIDTSGNPLSAKDYGPFLESKGFRKQAKTNYLPAKGDIAVMPAITGSKHGHIAGFDGSAWISDFIQNDMFGGPGYRRAAAYEVYRHP